MSRATELRVEPYAGQLRLLGGDEVTYRLNPGAPVDVLVARRRAFWVSARCAGRDNICRVTRAGDFGTSTYVTSND